MNADDTDSSQGFEFLTAIRRGPPEGGTPAKCHGSWRRPREGGGELPLLDILVEARPGGAQSLKRAAIGKMVVGLPEREDGDVLVQQAMEEQESIASLLPVAGL